MKKITLILVSVGLMSAAQAADRMWNAVSGDWHDAANWLDAVKPLQWDAALVDNGGVCELASGTVNVGADNVVGAAAFASAAQIPNGWSVRVNAASGTVTLSSGGMTIFVR